MRLHQTDRVLIALKGAGDRGITAVDFSLPGVVDGGPPITRIAARIEELRRDGHIIVSGERRQRCVVYRLKPAVGSASVSHASAVAPAGAERVLSPPWPDTVADPTADAEALPEGQLFDTTATFDELVPPLSPYEEAA